MVLVYPYIIAVLWSWLLHMPCCWWLITDFDTSPDSACIGLLHSIPCGDTLGTDSNGNASSHSHSQVSRDTIAIILVKNFESMTDYRLDDTGLCIWVTHLRPCMCAHQTRSVTRISIFDNGDAVQRDLRKDKRKVSRSHSILCYILLHFVEMLCVVSTADCRVMSRADLLV